jgi:hypothetical protein
MDLLVPSCEVAIPLGVQEDVMMLLALIAIWLLFSQRKQLQDLAVRHS